MKSRKLENSRKINLSLNLCLFYKKLQTFKGNKKKIKMKKKFKFDLEINPQV